MDLPDFGPFWNWVRDAILIGVSGKGWPEGDEDGLNRLAEACGALYQVLADMQLDASTGVSEVLSVWGGDVGAALAEYWPALAIDPGGLSDAMEAIHKAAVETSTAAVDVGMTKIAIWTGLAATILMVFVSMLAFSLGSPSAGVAIAGEAVMAGRAAIISSLSRLVSLMGQRQVLTMATNRALVAAAERGLPVTASMMLPTQSFARATFSQAMFQAAYIGGTNLVTQLWTIGAGYTDTFSVTGLVTATLTGALVGTFLPGAYHLAGRIPLGAGAGAGLAAQTGHVAADALRTGVATPLAELPAEIIATNAVAAAKGEQGPGVDLSARRVLESFVYSGLFGESLPDAVGAVSGRTIGNRVGLGIPPPMAAPLTPTTAGTSGAVLADPTVTANALAPTLDVTGALSAAGGGPATSGSGASDPGTTGFGGDAAMSAVPPPVTGGSGSTGSGSASGSTGSGSGSAKSGSGYGFTSAGSGSAPTGSGPVQTGSGSASGVSGSGGPGAGRAAPPAARGDPAPAEAAARGGDGENTAEGQPPSRADESTEATTPAAATHPPAAAAAQPDGAGPQAARPDASGQPPPLSGERPGTPDQPAGGQPPPADGSSRVQQPGGGQARPVPLWEAPFAREPGGEHGATQVPAAADPAAAGPAAEPAAAEPAAAEPAAAEPAAAEPAADPAAAGPAADPAAGPAADPAAGPAADPAAGPPAGPTTRTDGAGLLRQAQPLLRALGVDPSSLDRPGDDGWSDLTAALPDGSGDLRETAAVLAAAVQIVRSWVGDGEPLALRDVAQIFRFLSTRIGAEIQRAESGGNPPPRFFEETGQAPRPDRPAPLRLAGTHLVDVVADLVGALPHGYVPGDDLDGVQARTAEEVAGAKADSQLGEYALPIAFDPAHGRVASAHVEFFDAVMVDDNHGGATFARHVTDLLGEGPPGEGPSPEELPPGLAERIDEGIRRWIADQGAREVGWLLVAEGGVQIPVTHPDTGEQLVLTVHFAVDLDGEVAWMSPKQASARRAAARGPGTVAVVDSSSSVRRSSVRQSGGVDVNTGLAAGYTSTNRAVTVVGSVERRSARNIRLEDTQETGKTSTVAPFDPQGPRDGRIRAVTAAQVRLTVQAARSDGSFQRVEVTRPATVTFSFFTGMVRHSLASSPPLALPDDLTPARREQVRRAFALLHYGRESLYLHELVAAVREAEVAVDWVPDQVIEQLDNLLFGPGVHAPGDVDLLLRADVVSVTRGDDRPDVRIRSETRSIRRFGNVPGRGRGFSAAFTGILFRHLDLRLDVATPRGTGRIMARGAGTVLKADQTGPTVPVAVELAVGATTSSGELVAADVPVLLVMQVPAADAARLIATLTEIGSGTVPAIARESGAGSEPGARSEIGARSEPGARSGTAAAGEATASTAARTEPDQTEPDQTVSSDPPAYHLPDRPGPFGWVVALDAGALVADRMVAELSQRLDLGDADRLTVRRLVAEHFAPGALLAKQRQWLLYGGSMRLAFTVRSQDVVIVLRGTLDEGAQPGELVGNGKVTMAVPEVTAVGQASDRGWRFGGGAGARLFEETGSVYFGTRLRIDGSVGSTTAHRVEGRSSNQIEIESKGDFVRGEVPARLEFSIEVSDTPEVPTAAQWILGRRTERPALPGGESESAAGNAPARAGGVVEGTAVVWVPKGLAWTGPDRPAHPGVPAEEARRLADDLVVSVSARDVGEPALARVLVQQAGFSARGAANIAHNVLSTDNLTVGYRGQDEIAWEFTDPDTGRGAVVLVEVEERNVRREAGSADLNRKKATSSTQRSQSGRSRPRSGSGSWTSADVASTYPQDLRTALPGTTRTEGRGSLSDQSARADVSRSLQRKYATAGHIPIVADARIRISVISDAARATVSTPARSEGNAVETATLKAGRQSLVQTDLRLDVPDAINILRPTKPWLATSTEAPSHLPADEVPAAQVESFQFVDAGEGHGDGDLNPARQRAIDLLRAADPAALETDGVLGDLIAWFGAEELEANFQELWAGRPFTVSERTEIWARATPQGTFTYLGTASGVETVGSTAAVDRDALDTSRERGQAGAYTGEARHNPDLYAAGGGDVGRGRRSRGTAGGGTATGRSDEQRSTQDLHVYRGRVLLEITARRAPRAGLLRPFGWRERVASTTVALDLTVVVPAATQVGRAERGPSGPAPAHVVTTRDTQGTLTQQIRVTGGRPAGVTDETFRGDEVRLGHVDPGFLRAIQDALRDLPGRDPARDAAIGRFTNSAFHADLPAMLGPDGLGLLPRTADGNVVHDLVVRAELFDLALDPAAPGWLQERHTTVRTDVTSRSDSGGTELSTRAGGRAVGGGLTQADSGQGGAWDLNPASIPPPGQLYVGPSGRMQIEWATTTGAQRDAVRARASSRDVMVRQVTAGLVVDVAYRTGGTTHRLRFADATGRAVTLMLDGAALLGHADPALREAGADGIPLFRANGGDGLFLPVKRGPSSTLDPDGSPELAVIRLDAARGMRVPRAFLVVAEGYDAGRGVRRWDGWADARRVADLVLAAPGASTVLATSPSALVLAVPGLPAEFARQVAEPVARGLGRPVRVVGTPDGILQDRDGGVFAGRRPLGLGTFQYGEWYAVVAEPGGGSVVEGRPPMTRAAADLVEVLGGQQPGEGESEPDPVAESIGAENPFGTGPGTEHPDGSYPPSDYFWRPDLPNPHVPGAHPNVRGRSARIPPPPGPDAAAWGRDQVPDLLRDFVEVLPLARGGHVVWVRPPGEAADPGARASVTRTGSDPDWIAVLAHGARRADGAVVAHVDGRWLPPDVLAAAVNQVLAGNNLLPVGDQLLVCEAGGSFAQAYQQVSRRPVAASEDPVFTVVDGPLAGTVVATPGVHADGTLRPVFGPAGEPLGRFQVDPVPGARYVPDLARQSLPEDARLPLQTWAPHGGPEATGGDPAAMGWPDPAAREPYDPRETYRNDLAGMLREISASEHRLRQAAKLEAARLANQELARRRTAEHEIHAARVAELRERLDRSAGPAADAIRRLLDGAEGDAAAVARERAAYEAEVAALQERRDDLTVASIEEATSGYEFVPHWITARINAAADDALVAAQREGLARAAGDTEAAAGWREASKLTLRMAETFERVRDLFAELAASRQALAMASHHHRRQGIEAAAAAERRRAAEAFGEPADAADPPRAGREDEESPWREMRETGRRVQAFRREILGLASEADGLRDRLREVTVAVGPPASQDAWPVAAPSTPLPEVVAMTEPRIPAEVVDGAEMPGLYWVRNDQGGLDLVRELPPEPPADGPRGLMIYRAADDAVEFGDHLLPDGRTVAAIRVGGTWVADPAGRDGRGGEVVSADGDLSAELVSAAAAVRYQGSGLVAARTPADLARVLHAAAELLTRTGLWTQEPPAPDAGEAPVSGEAAEAAEAGEAPASGEAVGSEAGDALEYLRAVFGGEVWSGWRGDLAARVAAGVFRSPDQAN